jgi:AraC family transcriptional regulator of adaptative response/methylated-DNA-[protein]-cysteine methyltransferase
MQMYENYDNNNNLFSSLIDKMTSTKQINLLKASWFDTKLGPMLAIADEIQLYLLEFLDWRGLERAINRLKKHTKSAIISGMTLPIQTVKQELALYFDGHLKEFTTPIFCIGSSFQKNVWEALKKIPYGETRSYADIASNLGKPSAYRAVANANGTNKFAIVIPCHRVINHNGNLGGYGGGLARKKWLIEHEQR